MILLGIWFAGFGIEIYREGYYPGPLAETFYVEYGTLSYMVTFSFKRYELSLYTPIRKKNEHQFKQKINH